MDTCKQCGSDLPPPSKHNPARRFCSLSCASTWIHAHPTVDPTPGEIAERAAEIKAANLARMQAKQTTATENDGCDTYRSVPRREIYRHHGRRGVNFWRAAS